MVDINNTVSALKQQLGLPTAGGKQQAPASPTGAGASQTLQNNPASQVAAAQNLLNQIQNAQPASNEPSDVERALAAKEQTIQDTKTQNEQLQAVIQSQTEQYQKIAEMLNKQNSPVAPQQEPLPSLPDNIDELPADEQVRVVKDAFKSLSSELQARETKKDEALKNFFTPLGNRLKDLSEWQEQKQISEKYPQFKYGEFKPQMDQLRAELKGMTALEAAELIAAKTDPAMLSIPDADIPIVESSRASMATVSGNPGLQNPHVDDSANIVAQMREVAMAAHLGGKSVLASQAVDEILKQKLFKGRT